jgi:TPR repeat protein
MNSIFRAVALSIFVAVSGSMVAAQDYGKGLAAYEAGDYATALKELRPYAEQGIVRAQTNLGVMYSDGSGVLKDDAEAVRWFRLWTCTQRMTDGSPNLPMLLSA